jgi:catechol 2,3-dioxygenase-like lactoylglutathione lyase family enzyme
MSYVALATERYDDVVKFYGELLGFPVVEQWDRPNARGRRYDVGGMRLEIMDNQREARPLALGDPADRFHIVIETEDIEADRQRIGINTPSSQDTSWGARIFQIRDPDGVSVTFLQWMQKEKKALGKLRGRVSSGVGIGKHFTQLGWAREQFVAKLGIDPFPGTLNMILDDPESMSSWKLLRNAPGIRIDNPNGGPNDCDARCFPVLVNGSVTAAIVLPEVDGYSDNQIEIIASTELRSVLGIKDGDLFDLEVDWVSPHGNESTPEDLTAKRKLLTTKGET